MVFDRNTLCAPFVHLPSVTGVAEFLSKTPVLLLMFISVQPDDHVDGGGQFAARHAQDTRWRCDYQRGGNIPGIVAFKKVLLVIQFILSISELKQGAMCKQHKPVSA